MTANCSCGVSLVCSALPLSVKLTLMRVPEAVVHVCFYTVRLKLALPVFPCTSKNVSLHKLFGKNLPLSLGSTEVQLI